MSNKFSAFAEHESARFSLLWDCDNFHRALAEGNAAEAASWMEKLGIASMGKREVVPMRECVEKHLPEIRDGWKKRKGASNRELAGYLLWSLKNKHLYAVDLWEWQKRLWSSEPNGETNFLWALLGHAMLYRVRYLKHRNLSADFYADVFAMTPIRDKSESMFQAILLSAMAENVPSYLRHIFPDAFRFSDMRPLPYWPNYPKCEGASEGMMDFLKASEMSIREWDIPSLVENIEKHCRIWHHEIDMMKKFADEARELEYRTLLGPLPDKKAIETLDTLSRLNPHVYPGGIEDLDDEDVRFLHRLQGCLALSEEQEKMFSEWFNGSHIGRILYQQRGVIDQYGGHTGDWTLARHHRMENHIQIELPYTLEAFERYINTSGKRPSVTLTESHDTEELNERLGTITVVFS